ncbi:hypothetical protein JL721_9132 [Aureococcus anophagefferens]|nr:hypothetical protein JL721_9132 [Aureococcus anophagefferens]
MRIGRMASRAATARAAAMHRMRPGKTITAARRAFAAKARIAVLRTGDALLGYGGIADALFRGADGDVDLALVAVAADDSPGTLFDGVSDDSLMAAADAVLEGYGEDVAPTAEDAGGGSAKLVPGAAARARFDNVQTGGPLGFTGYDHTFAAGGWGPARLLATVVRVGDDGAVDVRAPRRVLRHAVALVWPEPLPLERVELSRKGGVFALLDGGVALSVDGRRVPLADPTYAVVPRDKRFGGLVCYAVGLSTLVGSIMAAHPNVGGSPLFLVGALPAVASMWAGGNWTSVWRALPAAYGGPDRPPLSRMK